MRIRPLHRWDVSPAEAAALQRGLAAAVEARQPLPHFNLVAGLDMAQQGRAGPCHAAAVLCQLDRDLAVVERRVVTAQVTFPYVPGLLSFREAPPVLAALRLLRRRPDVVLVDGHGLAHPRRFGLACHVGLSLNLPTVGCAKSRLVGRHAEPAAEAGSWTPLIDGGSTIGAVVRTRSGVKPVFVSVGHRIDLASAVAVVLSCCRRFRLPEPLRLAHQYANARRRSAAATE